VGRSATVDDDALLAEQLEYYRQRAPEYDRTATPPDDPLAPFGAEIAAALDRFAPRGDVLEIASGTGGWTLRLLSHASHVTALDAAPEMHEIARAKLGDDPRVRFVVADVFTCQPDRAYDVVFFANWLSHVPPARFSAFWDIVARAIRPDGRVFLIDERVDAWRHEALHEQPIADRSVPIVQRTLSDGTSFRVVKVFWDEAELTRALGDLGWAIRAHPVGPFLWAEGERAGR
jgi:SAM-dependent methyltransferase